MGLAVLRSRALAGVEAPEVTVEVHLADGLPTFTIVGLADTEVRESRDRVRAALQNSGFDFPAGRLTVNLAPADLPKESARFDLPIAIGILAASGQLAATELDRYEFAGELSLSGQLRPVRAALAIAHAMRSGSTAVRTFILPRDSAAEAALVPGMRILAADSLLQVVSHLGAADDARSLSFACPELAATTSRYPDLADVKGQPQARRALEIAAAGGHSLLMVGPPGAGKSMLAARLPGILPPMTDDEAMEAAAVASLAGRFERSRWRQRPYRAPHHTASGVALVGGSQIPRPGEISLAHHGVLFLDELPEFDRKVLEVLREPLESGHITISRAAQQSDFPCRFQLVAAMNPCPCGYLGHPMRACRCTPDAVARYQSRISGPLLDRIDLQLTVAAVPTETLMEQSAGENSATVAERVCNARARQIERQQKPNAQLTDADMAAFCQPTADGAVLLRSAIQRLGWSARAAHRVLKVARTIADLAGNDISGTAIDAPHVAEAIQYRRALMDSPPARC
ncbi:MAG: hypothetical protein RL404_1838 [Pseudomonadota bacterium]